MKKIKVVLDKQGKVAVDFEGFAGADCFHEAERLEKILAGFGIQTKIDSRTVKPPRVPERENPNRNREGL